MSKKLELKSTSCWQHSAKVEHFLCATAFGVGRSVAAMSLCICQPSPKMFLELKKKCLFTSSMALALNSHAHNPTPPASSFVFLVHWSCWVSGGGGAKGCHLGRCEWLRSIAGTQGVGLWEGKRKKKIMQAQTHTTHTQSFRRPFLVLFYACFRNRMVRLECFFSQDNSDETSALTILSLCFILLLDVKQKWSFRLLYFISNASLFSLITFKSPWPSIMSWKGLNCQWISQVAVRTIFRLIVPEIH